MYLDILNRLGVTHDGQNAIVDAFVLTRFALQCVSDGEKLINFRANAFRQSQCKSSMRVTMRPRVEALCTDLLSERYHRVRTYCITWLRCFRWQAVLLKA